VAVQEVFARPACWAAAREPMLLGAVLSNECSTTSWLCPFLNYPLKGSPPSAAVIGRGRKDDRVRSSVGHRSIRHREGSPHQAEPTPGGSGSRSAARWAASKAAKRGHGADLLFRQDCRMISWTFAKHVGQYVCVSASSAGFTPWVSRYVR